MNDTITVVVDEPKKLDEVSRVINDAYTNVGSLKLELFMSISVESRKFGFPIICTLKGKNEQLMWAAKLLLIMSESWQLEDIPEDFKLLQFSPLLDDVEKLLGRTLGNLNQLK